MIVTLSSRADPDALWPRIEEIFFLSSSARRFSSPEERARFFDKWTGYYRECEPDMFFLCLPPPGGETGLRSGTASDRPLDRVAGYLTGCRDSGKARRLYRDVVYYHVFEDQFGDYPAHFHVNCHPRFRGRGVGRRLVEAFLAACRREAIGGVHVVTAPDAGNEGFYRKCGFDFALERRWGSKDLLFLAASL